MSPAVPRRPSRLPRFALAAALLIPAAACSGDFADYFSEERTGNITVQFINSTPYRASFTSGAYDDLDRDPPGAVLLQQRAVEGNDSTEVITVQCRRDFEIGTDELLQRILDTNANAGANFNDNLFFTGVNFSSAPADSDAANLPIEGVAAGFRARLGIDFTCEDRLLFVFSENPAAPGTFLIELTVIQDLEDDR